MPDYVIGDMDSLSELNQAFFKKAGVKIVQAEDQNKSDLEKSLDFTLKFTKRLKRIIIHGSFGGRIDHTLSAIQLLHKFSSANVSQDQIILIDKYSKMIYI